MFVVLTVAWIATGWVVVVDETTRSGFLAPGFGYHVSDVDMWLTPERTPGLWLVPGYCKACRYDLTGNVSGVCPECGTSTGDG